MKMFTWSAVVSTVNILEIRVTEKNFASDDTHGNAQVSRQLFMLAKADDADFRCTWRVRLDRISAALDCHHALLLPRVVIASPITLTTTDVTFFLDDILIEQEIMKSYSCSISLDVWSLSYFKRRHSAQRRRLQDISSSCGRSASTRMYDSNEWPVRKINGDMTISRRTSSPRWRTDTWRQSARPRSFYTAAHLARRHQVWLQLFQCTPAQLQQCRHGIKFSFRVFHYRDFLAHTKIGLPFMVISLLCLLMLIRSIIYNVCIIWNLALMERPHPCSRMLILPLLIFRSRGNCFLINILISALYSMFTSRISLLFHQ